MKRIKKYFVANCSFGKDSLAMVLKLIELNYPLDEIVFFDFGMEYQCIHNNYNKFKQFLENNKLNIKLTTLYPKTNFYDGFEKYNWCGRMNRWGTTFKEKQMNKNIDEKLEQGYQVYNYIGIAIDEQKRIITSRQHTDSKTIKLYPLAEWGMTEKDCLDYCYKKGWNWFEEDKLNPDGGIELYKYKKRVSCKYCRFQGKKDLYVIYKYLPTSWKELKELQSKTTFPFGVDKEKTIDYFEKLFIHEDKNNLLLQGERNGTSNN